MMNSGATLNQVYIAVLGLIFHMIVEELENIPKVCDCRLLMEVSCMEDVWKFCRINTYMLHGINDILLPPFVAHGCAMNLTYVKSSQEPLTSTLEYQKFS